MGSLSISGIDEEGRHYLEIVSGHMVGGELLSDYEYALRGQPITDSFVPEQKGLPPYIGHSHWPLACSICGEWAGNLLLDIKMSMADQEAAALATPNRLCPKHYNDSRLGRLPGQQFHRG